MLLLRLQVRFPKHDEPAQQGCCCALPQVLQEPPEHTRLGLLQRLPAQHACVAPPQGMHAPLPLQMLPPAVAHGVPGALLVVVAVHTGPPEEQLIIPTMQSFPLGLQGSPAGQVTQVPTVLQTVPVPHVVPAVLFAISVHTGAPEEQTVAAVLHGFAEVQPPVAHAMQVPVVLQTIPVPHVVPGFLLAISVHTGVPEAQTVAPVLHGFVGVQVPVAHAMHVPVVLQTMPVPHDVPGARFPFGVHTGAPEVHTNDPVLHGVVGVQAMLITQVPQVPAPLQTIPVPHATPGATFPLSVHTGAPVLHANVPVLQAFAGVHDVGAQATQVAAPLHTMPVPHALPVVLFVVSTHTWDPESHENVPFLHGLVGWQAPPAVQAVHTPARQTRFVPQDAPFGKLVVVSVQVAAPLAHDCVPVWQVLAGVQVAPVTQATHLAVVSQTMFVPQVVPGALFVVSAHTDDPVTHDVAPFLHGFAGWQTVPSVHETHMPVRHTRFVPQDVPSVRFVVESVHVAAPVVHDWVPA